MMPSLCRAGRTLLLLAGTTVVLHANAQDERQAYMERAKVMASYYGAHLGLDEKATMALLPGLQEAERSVLDLRKECEQLAQKLKVDRRELEYAQEVGKEMDPEQELAIQKLENACTQLQQRMERSMMPQLERVEKSLTGEQRDKLQRMRDAGEWEQPAACCDEVPLPRSLTNTKPEKIDRSLGCCHWVVVEPMEPEQVKRQKEQEAREAEIKERSGNQEEAPGLRSLEKDEKKAPRRK
jgi:hypothetical protein